jgi:phosphoglycerate dehydrogenase-like enzyme
MRALYGASTPKAPNVTRGAEHHPIDDLFTKADFVSLHVPLTPETHHLVNQERLALIKPGAILINTARGRVVNTDALVETLKAGHLGARF